MLKAGWKNAHLAYKHGINLEKTDKRVQAISCYQKAIDLYPYHTLALERLAIALYVYSDEDNNESLGKAVELLRRTITIDPLLWDANIYLAMALDRLDQFDESRRAYERTMLLEPHKNIAIAFYADALSHRGYLKDAEKLFQSLLKKEAEWDLALRYYARHLMYRSRDFHDPDTQAAIKLLLQAVKISPDSVTNHYYLGLAYSWLEGHLEQAIHHTKAALRFNPDYQPAKKLLSELSKKQVRNAEP
jgi:tetratricopeptide (TPR) repeat protein